MTLLIRPIRLKRSVYFRVPNDIVDLINLEDSSQVILTLEEKSDRHLLTYSVLKNNTAPTRPEPELYPIRAEVRQSTKPKPMTVDAR